MIQITDRNPKLPGKSPDSMRGIEVQAPTSRQIMATHNVKETPHEVKRLSVVYG